MNAVVQYVVLLAVIFAVRAVFRSVAKKGGSARKEESPEQAVPAASKRARTEQKRAQMAQAELWRAAKRQQDDAEEVHSIKMDTCESRLENLRVLYNAGILDRVEYAERVARTKQQHFQKEA